MKKFIPRLYIKDNDSSFYIFDEIINKSQISIILGEPASGKTYQLKYFDEITDNTKFAELMFIENEENISDTTKYVLIDSIDEALSQNDNDKTTIRNLLKYIKKSLEINPIVKFVITCRYLEWKEIFEKSLKEIDKDIQIYHIQELNKEDINRLLVEKNIEEKDFWDFISQNFLDELLKNILMIINIIDNFEIYKSKSLKYFEIYNEIIKEHLLAKTENERSKQLLKISFDDMKLISSSLAVYFTLNLNRVIDATDVDKLASELYKINNIDITGEKLSIVLDSALFSGNRNNIRFFHKSIQEYLCAYFVIEKKLDIKTIKDIFSHNLGFYEEFEEVIIYLTNIEKRFFKHFVSFDPFIFRRHPYLDAEEQTFLLKNMLYVLSNEQQTAWGKWEYIENSSLVNFDNSINIEIPNLVKQNIDRKNINHALFDYVLSVLEHNYNKELQDFIFQILENMKLEIDVCFRYITRHRINNIEYNKELLRFILINNMLHYDEDYIFIHIFQTLYNHVEFKNLIILLQYFSLYTDKKVIENIDIQDLIFWFDELSVNYKAKYEKLYDSEQISFLIFLLLKYFEESKNIEVLKKVFSFLNNNHIYSLNFYIGFNENQYILEFNYIKNYFWEYFFSSKDVYINNNFKILNFYKKPINCLKEVIETYHIKTYKEHYMYLSNNSNMIENFDKFVLEDTYFKSYLEEEQKKWKEQKWFIEREKLSIKSQNKKDTDDKKYQKLINNFSTIIDLYNIYNYARNKTKNKENLCETLKNDLGEVKYKNFMDCIKEGFISDILYLKIKKDLSKYIINYCTHLFHFYFNNISKEYINELINTEEDYKKLFYHLYAFRKLESEYFLDISKKFTFTLVDLSIEILKVSTYRINEFVYLFKKLNIYDLENLKLLIEYIKSIDSKTLINIEINDKKFLLNILALEKENYGFIKSLYFIDSINEYIYFKSLLYIDINRAFDDYLNIVYPKGNKYLRFEIVGKINYVKKYVELNNYDNIAISSIYRKKFKTLLSMLYSLKENRNFENIYQLNIKNFKFIFINYYNFFKEYHYPKGTFSPDIYTNMYELINAILNYIGSSEKFISLLEDLQNTKNKHLKATIKYQLDKAYNYQQKNRCYTNKYYKDLLDNYSLDLDVFFSYEKLEKDLIEISLVLMKNRKSIYLEDENLINDRYRDALHFKGYIVNDQTRAGESKSGKSVGEIDLEVKNKDTNITESLIEAFELKTDNRKVIEEHYERIIKKYDTSGNENNFILVYTKYSKFVSLWEKYKLHFIEFEEINTQKENIKVIYTKYNNMKISHIFINFYTI
ncbi:hypothetical protein N5T63_10890 [Aliarcobacter cryaerophilus]|uniref:NACHT domain-containing protein n=1 Tax=Aliarcobacter cryaerophilus TaxID=28198 RepID=UPI0021B6821E|nr:hypothetical protein [Aliarcobacter cryaerophilus]MCT7489407.1 hypothetical protein [Aliarcobacter cryaerophilus]